LSASEAWAGALAGCAAGEEHLLLARLGVTPGKLPELAQRGAGRWLEGEWALDIANGMLYLPLSGDNMPGALDMLKSCQVDAQALGGYALMTSGPRGLLRQAGAWGAPRPAAALMRQLKLQWDAADVLNRGEFIGKM